MHMKDSQDSEGPHSHTSAPAHLVLTPAINSSRIDRNIGHELPCQICFMPQSTHYSTHDSRDKHWQRERVPIMPRRTAQTSTPASLCGLKPSDACHKLVEAMFHTALRLDSKVCQCFDDVVCIPVLACRMSRVRRVRLRHALGLRYLICDECDEHI